MSKYKKSQIDIVYFSVNGTTKKLAEAIAKGAMRSQNSNVNLHAISGKDIREGRYSNDAVFESIDSADALVFGSPTYMGGPASQFKAFADASSEHWSKQVWQNKYCAGFTVGSSLHGDQIHVIQYFYILAMQHSMYWLGMPKAREQNPNINPMDFQQGLIAHIPEGTATDTYIESGICLGERIANAMTGQRELSGGTTRCAYE